MDKCAKGKNTASETIVSVSNLTKTFSKKESDLHVLRGISFDVFKGDVLGIIGPSGSGKSTILRCLSHLETVTGGTISVCGKNLVKDGVYADKETLRQITLSAGLVFQNFNLFPHYSVLQNVAEPLVRVLGTPRAEANEIALAHLRRMALAEKAAHYPCELSGGQQQRVSIARALALKPSVLLFDEPTSALDPELTGEILAAIKDLATEKMTMIVVTHEMAFARDTSTKIIFMASGVIVEEGDPKSLIENPQHERTQAFLARFHK